MSEEIYCKCCKVIPVEDDGEVCEECKQAAAEGDLDLEKD